MARKRGWVFDPDSGGVRIPQPVQRRTEQRIRRYAEEHFAGRYARLEICFHGQFCYIDTYTEPEPLGPNWPPQDWPETAEERLRYLGDEEGWGVAFFAYSSERYELSVFPSEEFLGAPEDAFVAAVGAYLR
jgi:hypothetical protein